MGVECETFARGHFSKFLSVWFQEYLHSHVIQAPQTSNELARLRLFSDERHSVRPHLLIISAPHPLVLNGYDFLGKRQADDLLTTPNYVQKFHFLRYFDCMHVILLNLPKPLDSWLNFKCYYITNAATLCLLDWISLLILDKYIPMPSFYWS